MEIGSQSAPISAPVGPSRVSGWKEGAEGDAAGGKLEMEMARSGLLRAMLNPRTYIRPADQSILSWANEVKKKLNSRCLIRSKSSCRSRTTRWHSD
jgi:hypothetical protein